jgi:aryl-alcohol dehydrogenase-like predicted oxidoreductase
VLESRGHELWSNQIEYSLSHRWPEQTGLIGTCKEAGVRILAYSPLACGRLTGKYDADNPPKGARKFSDKVPWSQLTPLIDAMRGVAATHERSVSEVALKWCMQKGTVPIVGARTTAQMNANAGAADEWTMSGDEMAQLDELSQKGHTSFWQGNSE